MLFLQDTSRETAAHLCQQFLRVAPALGAITLAQPNELVHHKMNVGGMIRMIQTSSSTSNRFEPFLLLHIHCRVPQCDMGGTVAARGAVAAAVLAATGVSTRYGGVDLLGLALV